MGAGQHPRNRLCQPAPKGDDEKQRDRPAPRHPGGVARHHRGPPQRDRQLPGEPPPAAPGQRHWAEGSWLLCVAPRSPCLCHGDMGPGMNEGRKGPGRLQTRSVGWTGAVPAEHTEARGRPVGLSLREKEARAWALGPQAGEALWQRPRCYPPRSLSLSGESPCGLAGLKQGAGRSLPSPVGRIRFLAFSGF